jgi:hypothetical protein
MLLTITIYLNDMLGIIPIFVNNNVLGMLFPYFTLSPEEGNKPSVRNVVQENWRNELFKTTVKNTSVYVYFY